MKPHCGQCAYNGGKIMNNMSLTKEIIEQETKRLAEGERDVIHLHREGTFLRAYEWNAFLSCRYLHTFKVNKRAFKGIEQPVAYIGFPETSLDKWMPEGAELEALDEKHLAVHLPKPMIEAMKPVELDVEYVEWKESIPLTEHKTKEEHKNKKSDTLDGVFEDKVTITSVMHRILEFPIESKSPIESMLFLANVKRRSCCI